MGRGKREMKRIENAASRNVCFTKRRRGLLKKARELSILCDASVGVVIFSAAGRMSEYSSTSDMNIIIERYMKNGSHAKKVSPIEANEHMGGTTEVTRLQQCQELLEQEYRRMSGKDLGGITMRELLELQEHIELGLKRVRTRQYELLNEQMAEVQAILGAGLEVVEVNNKLRQQLNALLGREESASEPESRLETMAQHYYSHSHGDFSAGNDEEEDAGCDEDYDTSLHLGPFVPNSWKGRHCPSQPFCRPIEEERV
uniref:MADS1 n=1 Tax=Pinus tabuliformis TaxID=88731 RepID=A0A0K0M7C6_PINTB|nr:MADS1 [Pinus tabuliformis]